MPEVTPIEIVAREEWLDIHKDMERTEASKNNIHWEYFKLAFERAAKRFNYKPTFREWKAAKEASL